MQTVNFACTFCNKLMAVGLNLLGRNVRCPHCKQVVQAPATPTAANVKKPVAAKSAPQPTKTEVSVPNNESQESIFVEPHDDDLFGSKTSQVKAPPEPFLASSRMPPPRVDEPTLEFEPPKVQERERPSRRPELSEPHDDIDADELPVEKEPPPLKERPAAREGGGSGILVWMLLAYGLIATGVAAYLFYDSTEHEASRQVQSGSKENPFVSIPDFFGQYDRAERKKVVAWQGMPLASLAVPEKLQVRLNDTLTVGDLEVTPLEVHYRRVTRYRKVADRAPFVPKNNPDPMLFILKLKLKNKSEDVYFCPTDPAFARRKESPPRTPPSTLSDILPYTGLMVGKNFLAGGPFLWPDAEVEYEYFDGQQEDAKPLAPQEERTYYVGSDQDVTSLKSAFDDAKEKKLPIQWRVQLRRGLQKVKDDSGNEHDISVSTVIGVKLDESDLPSY